jgi:hypothetical protein
MDAINVFMIAAILSTNFVCSDESGSSLEEAQKLIDFDAHGNVLDWSFILASHGYDVPKPGIVIIDDISHIIFPTGEIV